MQNFRPTSDARIAFLFAGSKWEELIWWDTARKMRVENNGISGDLRYTDPLSDQDHLDPRTESLLVPWNFATGDHSDDHPSQYVKNPRRLNNTLVLHHRHPQIGATSPNIAIFRLTGFNYGQSWPGPVVVYSTTDAQDPAFLDVTMSDFCAAADLFKYHYNKGGRFNIGPDLFTAGLLVELEIQEPGTFWQLMVRYAFARGAKVIKAVYIACFAEAKVMRANKLGPFDVFENHPIFHTLQPGPQSAIIENLGIPLVARRYTTDQETLDCHTDSRLHKSSLGNEPAVALSLLVDIKDQRNIPLDFMIGWSGSIGSILVLREDQKELTVHHVQALVAFCKKQMGWEALMTMQSLIPGDDLPLHAMMWPRINHLRPKLRDMPLRTLFEEFFVRFKAERISEGDETWAAEISPYDI